MTNSLEPSATLPGSESGSRSSWHWRLEDSSGAEVQVAEGSTGSDVGGFPSQSDAESWIGEVWRDLLDDGVHQVTLFEAERQVYGPMGLHTNA